MKILNFIKKPFLIWPLIGLILLPLSYYYLNPKWMDYFDRYVSYYWLLAVLMVWGLLFKSEFGEFVQWIKKLLPQTPKEWLILIGLALVAALYCLAHSEAGFALFYDEVSMYSVAGEMFRNHRVVGCSAGEFLSPNNLFCGVIYHSFRPHLYPLILSFSFLFGGLSPDTVFTLNFFFYLGVGLAIFVACNGFGFSFFSSSFASMIWWFWPMVVVRSRPGGSEMVASMVYVLAFIFLLYWNDKTTKFARSVEKSRGLFKLDVLFGLTLGLAAQVREDSPALMALIAFSALPRLGHGFFIALLFSFVPYLLGGTMSGPEVMFQHTFYSWSHFFSRLPVSLVWLTGGNGSQTLYHLFVLVVVFTGLLSTVCFRRVVPRYFKLFFAWVGVNVFIFSIAGNIVPVNQENSRLIVPLVPVFSFLFASLVNAWDLANPIKFRLVKKILPFVFVTIVLLSTSAIRDGRLGTGQTEIKEFKLLKNRIASFPEKSMFFSGAPEVFLAQTASSYSFENLLAVKGASDPWWKYIQDNYGENIYFVEGTECLNLESPNYQRKRHLCRAIALTYNLELVTTDPLGDSALKIYKIKGLQGLPVLSRMHPSVFSN